MLSKCLTLAVKFITMKNRFLHHAGLLLLAFTGFSLQVALGSDLADCETARPVKGAEIGNVALFDWFTYKGTDDFYQKNPLSGANSFYNPILPGWYSDPSICRAGDDYYLVTSTFCYYKGVPIFHSKDLVNWKQIGFVLDRPSQLKNFQGQNISGGIFAPAISYNPHNRTFYMIMTNVNAGNFFVKTQNPFGEWSDPVYLPDVQGIDPSFFFDEDGKAYIVNNDEPDGGSTYDGHRAIRVQEFDVATEKTVGPRKMIVNGGCNLADKPIWIEGPHLYKIKGTYYLMCAEGGTGDYHSEVIFKGDGPMGTFTPWKDNPILTQRDLGNRPNPITCAGHADLIQTKEGDWWAVFLACRPIGGAFENLGRETFMMPVKWSEDQYPYMTRSGEAIPMVLKRDGVKRNADVTFGNFTRTDDFDGNTLKMEWQTLRGPATDLYSLTENPGFLTLKCNKTGLAEMKTPAFVCRRMQHHQFECSTRLQFCPSDTQAQTGMLLYKDDEHQYVFAVRNVGTSSYELTVSSIGKGGVTNLLPMNRKAKDGESQKAVYRFSTKAKTMDLKIVSTGTDYHFYVKSGKEKWTPVCLNVDAQYLSTAKAGGFTGSVIGLFAK